MTRFIDGGSGYLCQMEPVAHFGLGDSETVPAVYIRWTDGTEIYLNDLIPNSFVKVMHPGSG